ncbi:MAG: hypothetical protein UV38_C0002G0223 [candidate division TM6 bacterium GW2011_GWE2_42_60]|nr:MAG: hypothetical protein UV38_C0002G0223 [candidate division TM6 bacterium GW2011_GWE2_42_60]HBY06025.1 hypothetical protein [Candidatus Dependentiae bacterium]
MEGLSELRRHVSSAVIQTRRMLTGSRAGQFRIMTRGSGSDFDQLREYQPGDDVRFIDWKSSARGQHLVVREYRDERSRSIHLLLDCSRSMLFGTGEKRFYERGASIAAIVAVMGENAGDAVALHFMRQNLQTATPLLVGRQQTDRIVRELLRNAPSCSGDVVQKTAHSFARLFCKKSLLFLISDFIEPLDVDFMRFLGARYSLCCIRVRDKNETAVLDTVRFLPCRESEFSGQDDASLLFLHSEKNVQQAQCVLKQMRQEQEDLFRHTRVAWFDCFVQDDPVKSVFMGLKKVKVLL